MNTKIKFLLHEATIALSVAIVTSITLSDPKWYNIVACIVAWCLGLFSSIPDW